MNLWDYLNRFKFERNKNKYYISYDIGKDGSDFSVTYYKNRNGTYTLLKTTKNTKPDNSLTK